MDASLLPSSHARCEHLRVLLVIEPVTYAQLRRAGRGFKSRLKAKNRAPLSRGSIFGSAFGSGI